MTPTARTLQHLKKLGITADVVERWIAGAGVRRDFLGCIDVIYLTRTDPWPLGYGMIVGVQCTSGSNRSARRIKAAEEPRLEEWRRAGGYFEVWSWSRRGARGKRKLWTLRRERWDGTKWEVLA